MHFIKNAMDRSNAIGKPWAAVKARYDRKRKALVIVAGELPVVLKADAHITPLPEGTQVIDPDGKTIKASGRFHVTTETIDPFHCVTDLPTS